MFGNEGGFELVLQVLTKANAEEPSQDGAAQADQIVTTKMDLNLAAIILAAITTPYNIYHKEFIAEYGPKVVEISKQKLRETPERELRDVRRERIEGIIKGIDNVLRRLESKEEREKQTEILKLEVILMCLKSSFLERRIQGIRDLNTIIRNVRMFNNKSFTPLFLIEWMQTNGVFGIIFDPR
jgi:ubiquitin carboxyl-terminal hydrolase 34